MKTLKIELTDPQHKRLRLMAAEKCVAMTELVRWLIDGYCGKPVVGPGADRMPSQGGSTPPPAAKTIPVSSATVDLSVAPMAKCKRCFESFLVADMVTEPKSGKLYCEGCVENLRNNQ